MRWLLVADEARVIALGLGALLLGWILGRGSRAILVRLVKKTDTAWDDALINRLRAVLVPWWTVAITYLASPWVITQARVQAIVHKGLRAFAYLLFFWTLARMVDLAAAMIAESKRAALLPAARTLLPLGARVAKVALIAVAVVALLAELGYPVASLIAGLGVGGVALALASKQTLENLFGAFSIGLDEPLKQGDSVKVEDVQGTVEAIGLRSTRIRTPDRTIVSIPNGKLAELRIESYSARDRLRLSCTVGLEYGTSAAQMREVLEGLEGVLREHPKIWPDAVVVRFKELGASSLDIEVTAWFETTDGAELQLIRQEILLRFMEVVEQAGTSFASPTRTIHVRPPVGARPSA